MDFTRCGHKSPDTSGHSGRAAVGKLAEKVNKPTSEKELYACKKFVCAFSVIQVERWIYCTSRFKQVFSLRADEDAFSGNRICECV